MSQAGQHDVPLRTIYRQLYREKFWADVEAGVTKPFVLPLYIAGILIIPALYLSIPHKDRPWLYRARWPLLAVLTAFHTYVIRNVSSMNFAAAYGAGLIASWGIIWNFALLVWTRPQWDAKRVHIRRKTRKETTQKLSNGDITHDSATPPHIGNGDAKANGQGATSKDLRKRQTRAKEDAAAAAAAVLDQTSRTADLSQEYEYYWQEYPADASFWTRLDWVLALVTNVRMTGWNWAIPCLPPYEPPPYVGDVQLPLSSGVHTSRQGFTRALTRRQLLFSRLFGSIVPSYLVLDFCIVATSADPYFLLGPSHRESGSVPLPAALASLHPLALSALRTALAFSAILAALHLVWDLWALALAFPLRPLLGPLRSHPWHLPSMTGSFAQVLDRGLAGFWGAWWHQTFRFGFAAPALWLQRRGFLSRSSFSSLVAPALAFLQSGLVHAAASATTVAPSRWEMPLCFFLCAGAGAVLQARLSAALRPLLLHLPRPARRAGNLAFALLWMCATSWMLVDDFGRCGLFLYDPLPLSVFRPWSARLGGDPADTSVLRYDPGSAPRWVRVPGRWGWLQSGVAI
ncbi:membrane bound O-acyl transferase family-domain-containing protein [Biscogniauxia mediterranea]|nr:membrane bound O-acyl transferase family-domain-containing protein [Biscogniauxia mediterranea]